ncbi:hypothetical protein V8Z80_08290 [Orrella sp. JC864]|uniref:hypothetical protein n=1 Tax=Orrella sp. JC864 TaxID=3120298 RepID=UPI003008FE9E
MKKIQIAPEKLQKLLEELGAPIPKEMAEVIKAGTPVSVSQITLPAPDYGPIMAADAEQLAGLLEGALAEPFAVGDIVRLRPWAADRFKWPRPGEHCIVTQVLAVPYRQGAHGTARAAEVGDIALGFVDGDGEILEFLYDRRMVERVGSLHETADA